jgi:hypothetical protein
MKEGGVHLILRVRSDGLRSGTVVLESVLNNQSEEAISILPWNTPFDAQLSGSFLKIVNTRGEALPYLGRMAKRKAATSSDYIAIKPMAKISGRLDITESYKFCAGNTYNITFSGVFFQPNFQVLKVLDKPTTFTANARFFKC